MRSDELQHLDFSLHEAPLRGGGTEITVFGELDLANAGKLRAALERALGGEGDVVIDMRACAFIDSSGVGALAGVALRLDEQRRHLLLRGVRERVLKTFRIAGLTAHSSLTVEPYTDAHGAEADPGSRANADSG